MVIHKDNGHNNKKLMYAQFFPWVYEMVIKFSTEVVFCNEHGDIFDLHNFQSDDKLLII